MRTDALITALTRDPPSRLKVPIALSISLGLGIVVAAALFWFGIGPRPDLAVAIGNPRVLLKFASMLALAAAAVATLYRTAIPGAPMGYRIWLLTFPPLILIAGVVAELSRGTWEVHLFGTRATFCVMTIAWLSVAPLLLALLALRHGAPEHPARAGVIAGLFASGVGASLYAMYCPDDSPIFVATWYSAAVALVAFAGYLIGAKALRW